MERLESSAREARAAVVVPAIPREVRTLTSGAVSVVLHVPYESADTAFQIHKMQGKSVRVEIYLEGS